MKYPQLFWGFVAAFAALALIGGIELLTGPQDPSVTYVVNESAQVVCFELKGATGIDCMPLNKTGLGP